MQTIIYCVVAECLAILTQTRSDISNSHKFIIGSSLVYRRYSLIAIDVQIKSCSQPVGINVVTS